MPSTVTPRILNAAAFLRERIARLRVRILQAHVRVSLIFVVFQDEYDGKLPDRCQIQGLEERSLFACAVPEEAVNDLSCVLDLSRQSGACRVRNALANHARSAGKITFGSARCIDPPKPLHSPSFRP